MSTVPNELKYTKDHEWVADLGGGKFRVGITDYAQSALGDIVYIQLPKVGDLHSQGKVCGEVESTKSVSEIYAPLSGKVINVNVELDSKPETLNSEPYGAGWIYDVEITDSGELSGLLDSVAYQSLTA